MQKDELVAKIYNAFKKQINPIYNNLQMYLDGSETKDETLEIIFNNFQSCIRECAYNSCVSQFDDCPRYYVLTSTPCFSKGIPTVVSDTLLTRFGGFLLLTALLHSSLHRRYGHVLP